MCERNQTIITEMVLMGFGPLHEHRNVIFVFFLLLFIVAITGNLLIVCLVMSCPRLHSPMYFFLCNLSICEIVFTSNVVPNMLHVVWSGGGIISFYGCIAQFYLYTSSGSTESLILTIMAFDRYMAICNPLRYSSLMDSRKCRQLVRWAWLSGFMSMSIITVTICNLELCGSNTIDHLFCDLDPILQMTSMTTYLVEIEALMISIAFGIIPFLLIILSYVTIFYRVLRIQSNSGRQKAFSTCSSHLASVCTYFGTLFIIYLVPSHRRSMKLNKILSLLYLVGTPLTNPIIYSLRNQEIKTCAASFIFSKKVIDAH